MAFGILPTDNRLLSLSPSQELWIYAHLKKHDRTEEDKVFDRIKMICTFINPDMAKNLFTEPDVVENTGFLQDVMKMDPKFDIDKYKEFLD